MTTHTVPVNTVLPAVLQSNRPCERFHRRFPLYRLLIEGVTLILGFGFLLLAALDFQ